jgi:hypothetical protein
MPTIPEPYAIRISQIWEGGLRQYSPFTILLFRKYKASVRIENLTVRWEFGVVYLIAEFLWLALQTTLHELSVLLGTSFCNHLVRDLIPRKVF